MEKGITPEQKKSMTEFWAEAVREFGEGWALDSQEMARIMDDDGGFLWHFTAVLTNNIFRIYCINSPYGKPGMWHCSAAWPKNYRGQLNTPYGVPVPVRAINLSVKKTASAVGRELARRALPEWSAYAAYIVKLNADDSRAWDIRRAITQDLADSFGLEVSWTSNQEPRIWLGSDWPISNLEPDYNGNFRFTVQKASPEQTKKILKILKGGGA